MVRYLWAAPAALLGLAPGIPAQAQDYAVVGVNMFAENVRGGGPDDARGDFNGEFDFVEGAICYYLEVADLPNPNGAGIHRGGERDTGEEVVALPMPVDGNEEVCIDVDPALLRQIADNRDDYYMVVSNPGFPEGAIRGQLDD